MSACLPMPQRYSSKFEWAADFVSRHGMTLPPDTPELRSLRNWFCFKLNQFKKGTLGDDNITMLARFGLDFSAYEATNTGKGHRSPDHEMIELLRQWHRLSGGYDLSNSAPDALLEFHARLMDTFGVRGYTERARKIEAALDGFCIPLWRRAGQAPVGVEEVQWWRMAHHYDAATQQTPAYLGVIHPQADPVAADWACDQIERAQRLGPLQRGFLTGQGLLVPHAMRKRNQQREADRQVGAGVSLDDPCYGLKDRRLESFLGVCMYFRMVQVKSSDKEIMSAFGIDPVGLLALRTHVDPLCTGFTVKTVTEVRKLFPRFGEGLLKYVDEESVTGVDRTRPAMLRATHARALKSIKAALEYTHTHYIRQDIAIY